MESTTKIGGVGLGELGEKLVTAASRNEQLSVVAGADLKFEDDRFSDEFEATFDGANAYPSYDTMMDEAELDAVIIATPHTVHHEQAVDSIERGLDVFVEKPMVTDIDDALELYEVAKSRDSAVVQVGYPRHHHPAYQKMHDLVDKGAVGRIESVEGYLEQPGWINHAKSGWRTTEQWSGGGQLYDTGQHLLDSILFTTDTVPQTVSADTSSGPYDVDVDVDSTLTVELRQNGGSNGFPANIEVYGSPQNDDPSSAYGPETIYESLVINGSDGDLRYEDEKLLVTTDNEITVFPYETDFDALIQAEVDDFAAAIHGDDAHIATVEDGLYPVLIAEGAYEAADTGTTADVSAYTPTEQIAEVYADD